MKLILIDDEPKIRKGLTKVLSSHPGWTVLEAFSEAESVLTYLKDRSVEVDVIITDIRMPGMDGLDLIEQIRALHRKVVFVILSGYGRFEYAQRAIDLGVKKFLTKPTSPQELTQALEQIEEELQLREHSTLSQQPADNLLVRRAQEYIEQNYRKKFTLKEMAEDLYISPNYLSDQFKKHTGLKFSDYLQAVRMEKSREYLQDIRYTVGEVAELVGFADARYFSSSFRRQYQMTPMEYRRCCAGGLPPGSAKRTEAD